MTNTEDVLENIQTAYDALCTILNDTSGEDNLYIDNEIKDAIYNLNQAHYLITGCYL